MRCTLRITMRAALTRIGRMLNITGLTGTIRGRVLLAFVAIAVITGALGTYTSVVIEQVGQLVALTYDRSLMSINYARAASADFAAMEAASARRLTASDLPAQAQLEAAIATLETSLADDLAVAAERAQSKRAADAADAAGRAAAAWSKRRREIPANMGLEEGWQRLKPLAENVSQHIDLLINYTAGNGFTYRQSARTAVSQNIQFAIAATSLALLLSALVAWVLSQYITGAVAIASGVAEDISKGRLEGEIPPGPRDELGNLLGAMAVMRDNIKAMMEREVGMRQSAQVRLAEALESSSEGIVLIGDDNRLALANTQAQTFFGRSLDEPGWLTNLNLLGTSLHTKDQAPGITKSTGDPALTGELRLPDGRWLRVCQSPTREGGYIAIFSDISVLKDQEEKLKSAKSLLDAALDNMSQGLALYSSNHRLMMVNRRFCEIFKVSSSDAILGAGSAALHGELERCSTINADLKTLLAEEQLIAGHGANGPSFMDLSTGQIIAVNRQPFSDGDWVATYEDVTEQRRAEAQVKFMARHDALTGLANRIVLAERIEQEFARIKVTGKNFAVLCLDLDQFKPVNDMLGHPAGDLVLRTVAARLNKCVREGDTVARLGGDEFAILLQNVRSSGEVEKIAERIIKDLSAPYLIDRHSAMIGVSIGIAVAPESAMAYETLLKNADIALYLSKSEGRGTWRYFKPEMEERLHSRRAMEMDLKSALANNQFEVFYQPLMGLSNNQIAGFEALLRWRHPVRGMVSPAEFIPLAEEIGFIVPLGKWVMQLACLEALSWPAHIKVAVNVSAVQFTIGNLIETVKDVLKETGLAPERLELEITESVLLARTSEVMAALHVLRDLGIEISMDDFGTGYSSLSYLSSFPFDKIKIDRSFISKADTLDGSRAIVHAMVALGANLGIRTIAEGVETKDQSAWLQSIGCHEAQGYYFSPPVPRNEVPGLLQMLGCEIPVPAFAARAPGSGQQIKRHLQVQRTDAMALPTSNR